MSTSIQIENFQGILGNVAQSTVTQHLQMNIKPGDLEGLREYLRSCQIPDADIDELGKAIKADPKPEQGATLGARVGAWIGNIVTKAATGALEMTTEAVSTVVVAAIRKYYGLP